MSECEKYIELISAHVDGELSQAEYHTLAAHLATCPECRLVMQTFSQLSQGLFETMERAPENLADGIMYKIELQENPRRPQKRRHHFGRFTALAACLAIIVFASSRLVPSMLSRGGNDNAAMPEDSYIEDAPHDGNPDDDLRIAAPFNSTDGMDQSESSGITDDAPDMDSEGGAKAFGEKDDMQDIQYTITDAAAARSATDALESLSRCDVIDLKSPDAPIAEFEDSESLKQIYELLRWDEEPSTIIPWSTPDYSLVLTDANGVSFSIELWLTSEGIICGLSDDSGSIYQPLGSAEELLELFER